MQLPGPGALTCTPPFEHEAGGDRQTGSWGAAPLHLSMVPPHLAPSRVPIPPGHGCRWVPSWTASHRAGLIGGHVTTM